MFLLFINIFRSIGKNNFLKSFKILIILLMLILLEFVGLYLVIPIVNIFLGNAQNTNIFTRFLPFENISLSIILTIFIFVTLLRIFFSFLFDRKIIQYTRDIEKQITLKIYNHILNLPWKNIISQNNSQLIRTLLSDVSVFISQGLIPAINIFKDFIVLFSTSIFLFSFNQFLPLFFLFFFIFFLWILGSILKNKINSDSLAYQNIMSLKFQNINEGILGLKDIKLFGNDQKILTTIDKTENEITTLTLFSRIFRIFPRLFLELLLIIFVSSFILFNYKNGTDFKEIAPTIVFFIFLSVRLLPFFVSLNQSIQSIRQFSHPINEVINNLNSLNNKKHSSEKKISKVKDYRLFLNKKKNNLTIKNLSFKYDDKSKIVINKLNLKILHNGIVGIYGESGSGKTTLSDLLLGLLKPTEGKILFNNINISQHAESWNNFIGHVSQSIFLFNDSIKNNIILNDLDFNKKNFNKIIQSLEMNNFFKNLSGGYNSSVGDIGKNISGGQRQKIAIARMLYKNPGFILLDESTNSLDQKNEDLVFRILKSIKKDKIIFLITHSKRLFKYCDFLYELKNGKLLKKNYSL
jgi:ATP-binding cassette, subfamily B, bacterial PglK